MMIRKALPLLIFTLILEISGRKPGNCPFEKNLNRCRKALSSANKFCSAAKKCIQSPDGKKVMLQLERFIQTTYPGLFTRVQDADIKLREIYGSVGRIVQFPSKEYPEPPDRRPGASTPRGAPSLKSYKPVGSVWHPYPKGHYICKNVLHPLGEEPGDPDLLQENKKNGSKEDPDKLQSIPRSGGANGDSDTECLPCNEKADDKTCPNDEDGVCAESYRYVYMYMRRTDFSKFAFKKVSIPSCCECHNIGEDE